MTTLTVAHRAAAFFAALTIALGAPAAFASDVTFMMNNHHEFAVEVELYSQDRDHVWPGGGQVFYLDEGETICYGAWVSGDQGTYWGVGPGNADSCDNCCYVCEGGMTEEINLIE